MKVKIVRNVDNEDLGLIAGLGYDEDVNGVGAEEMPQFTPTRHELLQLAKYWQRVSLEDRYYWYLFQQFGSEWRQELFAQRRLHRIAEVLGEDAVKSAIDEVSEDFGKDEHPRTWYHFRNDLPLPENIANKYYHGEGEVTDTDWEEADLSQPGVLRQPLDLKQAELDFTASAETLENF